MRITNPTHFFSTNKTAKCKMCEREFQYFSYVKRKPAYCSNACKQKAYRRREEEKAYNRLGSRW